jgi:nitrate/nitrite transporter NarK
MTLYFQSFLSLSALQTSPRFLPMVISGALTNVATGMLVHKIRADKLVVVAAIISSVPGLLMAVANPEWSYWSAEFVGLLLCPVAADTLFTISNLVITSVFEERMQGVAGGLFNTVSMVGNSVGLAVTGVIAGKVSGIGGDGGDEGVLGHGWREDLLRGYRAAFWTCFVASVVVVAVTGWGLRGVGKVGVKRE